MTKTEFSLAIIKRHKKTKESYLDILLDIMNKENTEVSYDNVNKYLSEDLIKRLEEECWSKKLFKGKYKEGLFKMTDLM